MCPIFNLMWRYNCLNVTHKKPYKKYKEKTNDVLIAFIGYVNDLNKLQQFKNKCSKISPSTSMHFSTLLAIVRETLLRSSWRSCFMRAALFIMRATNSSLVFTFLCILHFSSIPTDKNLSCTRQLQITVSSHSLKIGHMFM